MSGCNGYFQMLTYTKKNQRGNYEDSGISYQLLPWKIRMQNFWFVMGKNGSQPVSLSLTYHISFFMSISPSLPPNCWCSLLYFSKFGLEHFKRRNFSWPKQIAYGITSSEVMMIQSRMRWLHMPKSLNFLLTVSKGRQFSLLIRCVVWSYCGHFQTPPTILAVGLDRSAHCLILLAIVNHKDCHFQF